VAPSEPPRSSRSRYVATTEPRPGATDGAAEGRVAVKGPLFWLLAIIPLLLLGALLALIVGVGPSRLIQGTAVPPVERLAITDVQLSPGRIEMSVLNDGPDDVTIAQVAVDDAFWAWEATRGATLAHLGRTQISIPYPWVHGETHVVRLLTSTGVTFEHVIGVAVETPRPSARFFGVFALIGLYVGVIPVALGLLWYPLMSRISRKGMQFLLALTVGLLAYLLVDSTFDGLEAAALVPGSLQGPALFVFGAFGAFLALDMIGAWLSQRRQKTKAAATVPVGWVLAVLIAVGIGLHNFGEGLAIGSAFALGELALGTLLIVGFTLHNTTEGLAIIAPLARGEESERVGLGGLIQLGLIGGVPTIIGAWIGAFVHSPVLAVFFLALGVGGIAQVTRQILKQSAGDNGLAAYIRETHVVAGLAVGVLVMYVTGLIVG
jgi:ZIP family zinc transporter